MAVVEVVCRKYEKATSVIKYGTSNIGTHRYHCKNCKVSFQLSYAYNGNRPETPKRIIDIPKAFQIATRRPVSEAP